MSTRPPIATLTPTGSEAPRRPADFLQPLARRVDQRPMTNQPQVQDTRKLTISRGIAITGLLKGCAKLVIEGQVEAELEDCQTLEIAEHGSFDGRADVESCEVKGLVEGDLTVRGRLVIRATGRVLGKVRYLDLHIEPGGKLAGQIEALEPVGERPSVDRASMDRASMDRASIDRPSGETRPAPGVALANGPAGAPSAPATPRFTLAQAEPTRPMPVLQPLELTDMADDSPPTGLTAERS